LSDSQASDWITRIVSSNTTSTDVALQLVERSLSSSSSSSSSSTTSPPASSAPDTTINATSSNGVVQPLPIVPKMDNIEPTASSDTITTSKTTISIITPQPAADPTTESDNNNIQERDEHEWVMCAHQRMRRALLPEEHEVLQRLDMANVNTTHVPVWDNKALILLDTSRHSVARFLPIPRSPAEREQLVRAFQSQGIRQLILPDDDASNAYLQHLALATGITFTSP
jgi:hypothetical protein